MTSRRPIVRRRHGALVAIGALLAGLATTVAAPAASADASCAPYTTLFCPQALVEAPRTLAWSATEGGLVDSLGVGTGFTLAQPAPNGSGYLPARLTVDTAASRLRLRTTQGLSFRTENKLDNALGMALRTQGQLTTVSTTVLNPDAGTGKFEQAGIWFGPSQDDYVKLDLVSAGSGKLSVQVVRELAGVSRGTNTNPALADEITLPAQVLSTSSVALRLTAAADTGRVTASYSVDNGAAADIGSFVVPARFFDGSGLSANLAAAGAGGLAGIYVSQRNNTSTTGLAYSFDAFSATLTSPPSPSPASPTGLTTAVAAGPSVHLSWTSPSGGDAPTAGFRVYRSRSATVDTTGTPVSGASLVTGTTYDDSAVSAGQTYSYAVVAVSSAGAVSGPSPTATVSTPAAGSCAPASPLPCSAVVSGDRVLHWSAGEGGLADANGVGTGMTMVSPTRAGGGYLPSRLTVDLAAGRLLVRTTQGLAIKTENDNDNAVGLGLHTSGTTTTLSTTLVSPNAGTGKFEQAGLWFGPSQDDYVKLNVVSAGSGKMRIQVVREMAGISRGPNTNTTLADEVNSDLLTLSASNVTLRLVATAGTGAVVASYSIDGAASVTLVTYTVPERFFDGSALPAGMAAGGSTGAGGVYTSQRNNTVAAGITYAFDTFSASTTTPPPGKPTALSATQVSGGVHLAWTAGSGNPTQYRVYRSTSLPVATTTPINGSGTAATTYDETSAVAGNTYSYVVVAVDASSATSAPSDPATVVLPSPAGGMSVKVTFSPSSRVPPTGYLRDIGEGYGARTGTYQGSGLTYGWIDAKLGTPVSLTANTRARTITAGAEARTSAFIHMAYTGSTSSGSRTRGSWELLVANGTYEVSVGAGDSAAYYDSTHEVDVEGQNLIAGALPSDEERLFTASRIVHVEDGALTISTDGGLNTKLDYVDVQQLPDASNAPRITAVAPANAAAGATTDVSVTAELHLPTGGLDVSTITGENISLVELSTATSVPAQVNTSGGGDVIVLVPDSALASGQYRFSTTSGVKDTGGHAVLPWSSVFTVGSATASPGIPGVAFDKVPTTATGHSFSTVVVGPDHRLYAGTLTGEIIRYDIATDGTLSGETTITTVPDHDGEMRTVIGMAFDPSAPASAPVLWITDNALYTGEPNVPDWSGKVARLSGPNLSVQQDVIVNLPRSVRDHETNSLAFGPDGAIYVSQGSDTAMGEPDSPWGFRPEHLLNAAILRLDASRLPATLPVDVKTENGGSYSPFAAGAPLTIYASGVRNAYDLVWHSNGHLYAPTNGSAAGGNTPASTQPCSPRVDSATAGAYTGPSVGGLSNVSQPEPDWLFKITAGGYYGHPNPTRCEFVLNGGNPTSAADPYETSAYPRGVLPDRNYRSADVYNIGVHASADGAIEYFGNAFGGVLRGKLLIIRYSAGKDILVVDPSGAGGKIMGRVAGVAGFTGFSDPLDLVEDRNNGNLYVTELGTSQIRLLRPHVS